MGLPGRWGDCSGVGRVTIGIPCDRDTMIVAVHLVAVRRCGIVSIHRCDSPSRQGCAAIDHLGLLALCCARYRCGVVND